MKRKLKRLVKQAKNSVQPDPQQREGVPRITAETVEEHREEVLSSARRFIYPLQFSKYKIVKVSLVIFVLVLVSFFIYSVLALYRYNNSSKFMYKVTQVLPFPVAKTGSQFVAYENYLFELRRQTHYYTTQRNDNFLNDDGKQQLLEFRKRAREKALNDALVRQLAKEHNVKVEDKEVDDLVTLLRQQNRLGGNDKAFEEVLREFWDWSVSDFKRQLKQQLLQEKVVSALDTDTQAKAKNVLAEIKSGKDFADAARGFSEDEDTRGNGGEFGFLIDKNNPDILPKTIDALFKLNPGEVSEIIDLGYGLEIVKVNSIEGSQIKASHIIFNFQPIDKWLNELKDRQKSTFYLKLPE